MVAVDAEVRRATARSPARRSGGAMNPQSKTQRADIPQCDIWPLGLNHSTSKLEKPERMRRQNEANHRLLTEFASLSVHYCEASKFDDSQRKDFFQNILGFLNDK
jgi:hypothetical protein